MQHMVVLEEVPRGITLVSAFSGEKGMIKEKNVSENLEKQT